MNELKQQKYLMSRTTNLESFGKIMKSPLLIFTGFLSLPQNVHVTFIIFDTL